MIPAYGIFISGGENIHVIYNKIFGRKQPFTNIGLFVWNQYDSPCGNHIVKGNQLRCFKADGPENPCWNANNCGTVAHWDENNWHADIKTTRR